MIYRIHNIQLYYLETNFSLHFITYSKTANALFVCFFCIYYVLFQLYTIQIRVSFKMFLKSTNNYMIVNYVENVLLHNIICNFCLFCNYTFCTFACVFFVVIFFLQKKWYKLVFIDLLLLNLARACVCTYTI